MNENQKLGFPDSKETLHKAILEADLLLAYAASHALTLKEETVNQLVQSKQLLHADPCDPQTFDQQFKFWTARNELAAAVRPISATSLRQSTFKTSNNSLRAKIWARLSGQGEKFTTGVERAISKMQFQMLFPILLLLVIQVYTMIGARAGTEATALLKELTSQVAKKNDLPKAAKDDAPTMEKLDRQIDNAKAALQLRTRLLVNWNKGWNWAVRFLVVEDKSKSYEGEVAVKNSVGNYSDLEATIQSSLFALNVLQKFILPMLYGYLGAALFVLRSLATDAKDHTYDLERHVVYNLRLYMGTLCGLVIAWFMPEPGDAGVIKSLTPYTFSVLGGYSVDVVFSLMDKMISSITRPAATTPTPPEK